MKLVHVGEVELPSEGATPGVTVGRYLPGVESMWQDRPRKLGEDAVY